VLIPGHLAAGVLAVAFTTPAHRRPHPGMELGPVLLGALTPDLIDKPLQLLGVFVDGRSVGHSLVFLALAGIVWGASGCRNARWARPVGMWALGIATHFVADFVDGLVRRLIWGAITLRSWFAWPFSTRRGYTVAVMEWHPFELVWITPLEIATIAAAAWVMLRWRKRPRAGQDVAGAIGS